MIRSLYAKMSDARTRALTPTKPAELGTDSDVQHSAYSFTHVLSAAAVVGVHGVLSGIGMVRLPGLKGLSASAHKDAHGAALSPQVFVLGSAGSGCGDCGGGGTLEVMHGWCLCWA